MSAARKLAIMVVVVLGTLAQVSAATAAGAPAPVRDTTLVSGPPVAWHPVIAAVDLQHGLVAGTTAYVHSDGFVYTEVRVPFLWSQHGSGSSVLFEPPDELATFPSIYVPNAMTANGNTVVGGVIFPSALFTEPWAWTPTTGLEFLQLPTDTRYGGSAVGLSNDGTVIAGTLAGRRVPSKAALWQNGTLEMLPSSQTWSTVNGISGDGSTVIGASGPLSSTLQATRWVDGTEQPLPTGDIGATSSTALRIANNGVIFGTATLSDGRTVLLRWGTDGQVTVLTPPDGLTVANFSSIDSVGSAAGGALAPKTGCIATPDPACNQEPFVWTAHDGFTILPETPVLVQNRDTYGDGSSVSAVADGGRVAVGTMTPRESINGFPPQNGFVWSNQSGLVLINDLMAGFGQPNPDYFGAGGVSPDGSRVLVFGNAPNNAVYDTGTLILNLAPLWTGSTGGVSGAATAAGTAQAGPARAGTAQGVVGQDEPLKQQLMNLPTDLREQVQAWPGMAQILG